MISVSSFSSIDSLDFGILLNQKLPYTVDGFGTNDIGNVDISFQISNLLLHPDVLVVLELLQNLLIYKSTKNVYLEIFQRLQLQILSGI